MPRGFVITQHVRVSRFGVGRHLAQGQMILHRPGADQVQGRLTDGAPRRTPRGLPIDGHRPQLRSIRRDRGQALPLHQRRHPGEETPLEGPRVEQTEDAAEGVMRRHAPWQGEEGLQPVEFRPGVVGDFFPALGPAQHGADGHEDDLVELVDPSLVAPWIGQRGAVFEDRGRVVGGGTRWCVEIVRPGAILAARCGNPDRRSYRVSFDQQALLWRRGRANLFRAPS
jgi:hypothetical protein